MESLLSKTGLLEPIQNGQFLQAKIGTDSTLVKFKCGNYYEITASDVEEFQNQRQAEIKEGVEWLQLPVHVMTAEVNEIRRLKKFLRKIHDKRKPVKVLEI